jgi:hypothetical protein
LIHASQYRERCETVAAALGRLSRETYLTFALWTAAIAIVMWVLALVFSFAGL